MGTSDRLLVMTDNTTGNVLIYSQYGMKSSFGGWQNHHTQNLYYSTNTERVSKFACFGISFVEV